MKCPSLMIQILFCFLSSTDTYAWHNYLTNSRKVSTVTVVMCWTFMVSWSLKMLKYAKQQASRLNMSKLIHRKHT